ncbi:hypothetical protein PMIT1342_00347 [Prochlorococcus marinus str. MIT 1342]|nr:hypothetical protein PMIT1342_00347 [Prochlorococcus marinus str. MIT 1342]
MHLSILNRPSLINSRSFSIHRSILFIFALVVTSALPVQAFELPPDADRLTNHYADIKCRMLSEGRSLDVIDSELLYAVKNDPRTSTYNDPQKVVVIAIVNDKVLDRCAQYF